jgi:pimeloyl-ACP methyl ester carboxylesterase
MHHFRVITYQPRGEDDCFALRQCFSMRDLVEDLRELLDHFQLESPPVLAVSFGGVLALELAAAYPWRVSSLILQGVGARFEQGLLQQVASIVLSRYPLPADNPFVNQFFNLLFGGKTRPGPLVDFVTQQIWQTDQGVMAHRFHLVETTDLTPRLAQVRVPALLMAGNRDLLVSDESLRDLASGLARSRVVRLPGAGHLAFVTRAERIAEEVRRFLK